MEKPKRADFTFHFGMCKSFRKESYDEAMMKYKQYLRTQKQLEFLNRLY